MSKNKLVIIGLGRHARRIYFPIISGLREKLDAEIVGVIDVVSQQDAVNNFLVTNGAKIPTLFVDESVTSESEISQFAEGLGTNCVVISTGPEKHIDYACWAISKGYHILMDKPLHIAANAAHDPRAAKEIHAKYKTLLEHLENARRKTPGLVCEVMTQRRHHPAFQLIKSVIEEVYDKTSCPITYYYGFHNDGQWRMPAEIRDINYHGFGEGYGKASHSGYHFYDLFAWWSEAYLKDCKVNSVSAKAWPNYPMNATRQINHEVLERAYPGSNLHKDITPASFKGYGEVDVMSTIELCSEDTVLTHAQIDLLHSGFSSRSWPTIEARDLYKENGRVRHEQHYISMGPFLAISLTSWQSKPFQSEDIESENIFNPGHEFNLDIDIFRNSAIIGGKPAQSFTLQDIYSPGLSDYSRGHQEDARRAAITEYFKLINSGEPLGISSLESHELSSNIIATIYESLAMKSEVKNAV